mgnify:CR=1 FL=1
MSALMIVPDAPLESVIVTLLLPKIFTAGLNTVVMFAPVIVVLLLLCWRLSFLIVYVFD